MTDVLVLCYHAVSARWPAALAVDPGHFAAQLRTLVDRGYVGVTFHDAVCNPPPGRIVAVTFDDGYRSVHRIAWPLMRELGLPGTLFVPTGFVGSGRAMDWSGIDHWRRGPHDDDLLPLNWDEVAALAADGWEIGSHTCTHPRLTRLDDGALRDELCASRARCADRLGIACRSLAYPYGDVDERVARAAAAAGYAAAAELSSRLENRGPLRWPRVGVYRGDTRLSFRLKVSAGVRAARATATWAALHRTGERHHAAAR